MGRKSRRKRQRAKAAKTAERSALTEPAERRGRRGRRGRKAILVSVALAAAAVAVLALWISVRRPAVDRPAPTGTPTAATTAESAGPLPPIPDPDTSSLPPPVVRALSSTRALAAARPASAAAVGRFCEILDAHVMNDEAAACYERAHRLAPSEFRWIYLLAAIEDIRGTDPERIDRLFERAIGLAPAHAPAWVRHADALMRLGRWGEARDRYRRAIELDPTLVLAHRGLGQAEIQLGDGAAALPHLERAAELAPTDRITQTALARAYALAGRSEEATAAADRARQLTGQASLPDQIHFEVENLAVDPESLRARITHHLRRGDLDSVLEAVELLEESAGPGTRRALADQFKERANRLAFSGEYDAALAEFDRAALLAPDDPEIEHNRGTVRLRQGELEAAHRHFERALELNPTSADSLYNLGVVLEGLGRQEEAVQRFRSAAALAPQHVAAQRLRELGLSPEGE